MLGNFSTQPAPPSRHADRGRHRVHVDVAQAVVSYLDQAQAGLLPLTGDPVAAQQIALQTLDNLRQEQSSSGLSKDGILK